MVHVLLTLVAVIALGRLLGPLFRRLGQPAVIGEVVAGILLGPTVLGHGLATGLLPPAAAPQLAALAQLGVILFLFLVGLEVNHAALRRHLRSAAAISLTSIALPFALGMLVAHSIHERLAPPGVAELPFALFLGVALSITAFPVLARILTDLGLAQTELGTLALACAATDDATAWCLLAVIVGVAQAEPQQMLLVVAGTVAFVVCMFAVVRPVFARLCARSAVPTASPAAVGAALLGLLISALATEALGIHALFGAFLFGALLPRDTALVRALVTRLRDLTTVVLLPAFFALTGLRTELGLVAGWENWLTCGLIVAAATAGKVGGAAAAGRATGLGWREAMSLGLLMNTRGLMELVVVNIGLELGVISPALFAMLVMMALVTTMTASPLVVLLLRQPFDGESGVHRETTRETATAP